MRSGEQDDEPKEPTAEELIESIIADSAASRRAPDIDDLDDAVVDGAFLPKVGDAVVVERWFVTGEKRHWIGTNTYRVVSLHESGDVALTDVVSFQAAMANWRTAPGRGWRFKLPRKSGLVKRRRRIAR